MVEYLQCCEYLIKRTDATLELLASQGLGKAHVVEAIAYYLRHARHQSDLVNRRLLRGEKIPADEKLHSIFETHARWVSKDKAGRPVELGVPANVVEDEHQFILHIIR